MTYVIAIHVTQEIAVNTILTKEEWETMPGGLFDQVNLYIYPVQGAHISHGNQIHY